MARGKSAALTPVGINQNIGNRLNGGDDHSPAAFAAAPIDELDGRGLS